MFGKLFEQMYDSSLVEHWETLVTFQQLIVLCDADGVVDMTPEAIIRRTNLPAEVVHKGLAALQEPDPRSRTPDEDGRRIVLLDDHRDWGWRIVNHSHYRNLASKEDKREKDRLRIAAKREKSKEIKDVAGCRDLSRMSPMQDADADTDTPKRVQRGCTTQRFDEFWTAYPRKLNKRKAQDTWKRRQLDRIADEIISDVLARKSADPQWLPDKKGEVFIPLPTTYLNGSRWEDEWAGGGAESDWDRAVRLAKERNLDPFRGAPYETADEFKRRVEEAA